MKFSIGKGIAVSLFFLLISAPLFAQELQCEVKVDLVRLPSDARLRLGNFVQVVESYLNNYRWTNEDFTDEDRISCNMEFIFTSADVSASPPEYTAQVFIGSSRPVYNSLRKTIILKYLDQNMTFTYDERQGMLQHNELVFQPLPSFLSFYAMMILGYDFDSFSVLGGTSLFERASKITRQVGESSFSKGWNIGDAGGQNRSAIVNEMLDPRFEPIRKAFFDYHYNGLDEIYRDKKMVAQTLKQVIQVFAEIDSRYQQSLIISRFFGTKYSEIAELLKNVDEADKKDLFQALIAVDPSHKQAYDSIFSQSKTK
ncbi:DUF4835 family protein [Chloroherpeton thalassium]|nr:DUF4835 family protein [Chloroherpeton thalassium]